MENREEQVIFSRNTVEFVTVAAEFCAYLERAESLRQKDFVDTVLKILPLLYIKASMLPECEALGESEPETFVTEEDYEVLRYALAALMADKDDYLEVFMQDMRYSDTPILRTISEDLTDIYQDVKNFVTLFKLGFDETMHDALAVCRENFSLYWGQTLVNTMRALHSVKYAIPADDENMDDENFD
ncbi:MAG: DUF5063 domain-containing protein [Bacteroidaceae bacterium]|nr:DUF5063 domain-containing protein [Bacteroidaceae bacterium]